MPKKERNNVWFRSFAKDLVGAGFEQQKIIIARDNEEFVLLSDIGKIGGGLLLVDAERYSNAFG